MIQWSLCQGVYEVKLCGEPCNEIGTTMLAELETLLDEIDVASAHALVIHSTMRSGFSAGADLRELYRELLSRPSETHGPELKKFLTRIHDVMTRLDTLPLVTIGVVHGVCFGGGFELALTCDVLIAEPTARFCFPELRLGIIPCFGGIPRLKREVPNSLVRDLLLTGRSINAKKAHALGLVSQLAAEGQGLTVARKMAEQVTKFDREARMIAKAFIKPLPKAELEQEKEFALRLFQNRTVTEALRKFVESHDLRPYLA